MKAKVLVVFAAMVLPVGVFAAGSKSRPVAFAPATLRLHVDVEGAVSDARCHPNVAAAVCALLVNGVKRWKFTAGQRDGMVAALDINVTLQIEGVPKDGGFALRAVSADLTPAAPLQNGEIPTDDHTISPPRYPPDEIRRDSEGVVVVELWRDPGSEHPRLGQIWFNGKAGARSPLVEATRLEAARWSIRDWTPEQKSVCMPVVFKTKRSIRPDQYGTPCKPVYIDGFAMPTLITDFKTAVF